MASFSESQRAELDAMVTAVVRRELDRDSAASVGAGYIIPRSTTMPATTLTPEQEARVVELVQQEVARTMSMTDPDHDFTPNGQGGYTATAKGGGEQPQQPQGDAGNTFVPSIGKFLPNAMVDEQGNKEGPMAYVSRVAMLLSNGDAEKARELVNDLGALSPQGPSAGSYGFTADLASYPAAAAEFAKQIFSKPGAGNIGR